MKRRDTVLVACTVFGVVVLSGCQRVAPAEECAAMADRLEAEGVPVVSTEVAEGTWGNTLHAVVQMDDETPLLTAWVYVAELHREVYVSRHVNHLDFDCVSFRVLDSGGGTVESGDILLRDYVEGGFEPPITMQDDEVSSRICAYLSGRGLAPEDVRVWCDDKGFRRARIELQTAQARDIRGRLEVDEFMEDIDEELNDAGAQIAVLYVDVDGPNGEPLLRYVCDYQCMSETGGHADGVRPWWSVPVEGAYGSSSLTEPEIPLNVSIGGQEKYLLGEVVRYDKSHRNPSSRPVTIDPYPPACWVKSLDRDVIVYSSEGGDLTEEVEAGDSSPPTFSHWLPNEEVDAGQEITPGRYEITRAYIVRDNLTGKVYTVTDSFQFELVAPASARTGDLQVSQSVTAEGMTVTLEHIEMDAVGVTVYTFTTPQGYGLPEEGPPYEYELFGMHSRAEYSIDGSPAVELEGGGGKFTPEGITLTWDGIEPIPVDIREFSFIVTRLGDVEGRWEFRVELE